MNKPKPKVGDTLYSLNIGESARYRESKLAPVKVFYVGRKYFTAGEEEYRMLAVKYRIDDWSEESNFSPNSKLYSSPQEWEESKEIDKLSKNIAAAFQYGRNPGLTLEELRTINAML